MSSEGGWRFLIQQSIFFSSCSAGDKIKVINSADENWWEVRLIFIFIFPDRL